MIVLLSFFDFYKFWFSSVSRLCDGARFGVGEGVGYDGKINL